MGTLAHRQPQHPFLRAWAERTLALLETADDRDLCIVLSGYVLMCFLWWGESVKARAVIETLAPWTHTPDIAPMVYLLWSCAVALYHSVHGGQEACLKSVEDGLALARKTGLHCWDLHLCDHPWVVAPRERLRAKYLQHLLALGRAHEAEGRWEEAVSWYRRGIEADELVEAFYQRLMRCYQHLARMAEARATGERCRRVLAAGLGTPPSAETQALIRTLGL